MRKLLIAALSAIASAVLLSCFCFAAEPLLWNFDESTKENGWSINDTYSRYSFNSEYLDGLAKTMSNGTADAMLISPAVNINAADYKYLVVRMKYERFADWAKSGAVFFLTEGGKWDADHCVLLAMNDTKAKNFKNYVFDMSSNENWTGIIKNVRLDPIPTPGLYSIKWIMLTNTIPKEETEISDVTTPDSTTDSSKLADTSKKVGEFVKTKTYSGSFADVSENAWFYSEVSGAYELGIIDGKSDTSFDPDGTMTVAEAITLAARTNNNYGTADYVFSAKSGESWYKPYVDYAVANGIITEGQFSDFDRKATRGEMAMIFAKVLPDSAYTVINGVSYIPDVKLGKDYYSSVLRLYNAGIVMGSDGYGNFNPDSNVKRSEAAAIINRVALTQNRIKGSLLQNSTYQKKTSFTMKSEAKYLADDRENNSRSSALYSPRDGGLASGWNFIGLFDTTSASKVEPYQLSDTSKTKPVTFTRTLSEVNDGRVKLEAGMSIGNGDGIYISLDDKSKKSSIRIQLINGTLRVLNSDGSYTDTFVPYEKVMHFTIYADLDAKNFDLAVNGAYVGTYNFAFNGGFATFTLGSTEEAVNNVNLYYFIMRHNYLLSERFANAPNGVIPSYDWTTFASEGGSTVEKVNVNTQTSNGGTLRLTASSGEAFARASFAPAGGKLIVSAYTFMEKLSDNAAITLLSGDKAILTLNTRGGKLYANDVTEIRDVPENLWNIIRIEADFATGKADIKMNGKLAKTVSFDNSTGSADGIKFGILGSAILDVDNVYVWQDFDIPDYCPKPEVPAGDDDYLIGVNVCSLWRTGAHYGWDVISGYPEIEPVLGYYDEGTPETSDWEVKFMAEHGIDFEYFCWYADASQNKPIFRTNYCDELLDGYFNGKYSDYVNFAINWENTNTKVTPEAFEKYLVPYWIEYFFKDSRYQKVNNKPILGIWSQYSLTQAWGTETTKKELDYLKNECKKAGFADCLVLFYSTDSSESAMQSVKNCGADGILPYHWGASGADVDTQISKLSNYKSNSDVHVIPGMSVGFDYVGWGMGESRNGLISPENYEKVGKYIRDNCLAQNKGSDFENMVIVSTWNEYGEGTYVSPTARYGFGYLDAVRNTFTKGSTDHTDAVPTTSQKQRINYLYDQSRQQLRPQNLEKVEDKSASVYDEATVAKAFDLETIKSWGGYALDNDSKKIEDGVYSVKITGDDPAFLINNLNVPTKDFNNVKVVIKINCEGAATTSIESFFATSEENTTTAEKSERTTITTNQWVTVYIPLAGNAKFKGNLTSLRIDPCNKVLATVEIKSIELVKVPDLPEPFTIDINGDVQVFSKEPEVKDGHVLATFYPGSGIVNRLITDYTWDKNSKKLTVFTDKHSVTFNVGSSKSVIDGKESDMGVTVTTFDGLPVIPYDVLCTALDRALVWHDDKNGVSIMLGGAEYYDVLKNRVQYEWEFELPGDKENWTLQGCNATASDGNLRCTSTGNDPAIMSPALNLDADKYTKIIVRMKYQKDVDREDLPCIYFQTTNGSYAESRRVNSSHIAPSSDGKYIDLEFDMASNLQWYGKVSSIRFDPINSTGTFDIDYIRCIKSEDAIKAEQAEVEAEKYKKEQQDNLSDKIYNGDAEITSYAAAFHTGNAKISIVEDPEKKGNHVYQVLANGGQQWTYFRQTVILKPETEYIVEFDVMYTGKNNGETKETGNMNINFIYAEEEGGKVKDHNQFAVDAPLNVWTHVKVTAKKTAATCIAEGTEFAIYANPQDGLGVNYMIDNVSITAK